MNCKLCKQEIKQDEDVLEVRKSNFLSISADFVHLNCVRNK